MKIPKKNLGMVIFCTILLLGSKTANAQMPGAITIDPPNATAYDEITLYFDPELACFESASLIGMDSIAMHSGVTLFPNITWNNVIDFNGTGVNGQSTTLYPTGDGRFSKTYTPSEFYGLDGEIVTEICAVFNNGSNWFNDGRDFDQSNYCMDFFIPISYEPPQNNPIIQFEVNMHRAIANGTFYPETDELFVVMEDVATKWLSDPNGDGKYTGQIDFGLTLGETYDFIFCINYNYCEDNYREITVVNNTQTVTAWWNNEPLGTTFIVDMTEQINLGNFNPETDFVDLPGTMNNWNGTDPLMHIGDGMYETTLLINTNIAEYKFRINGDWATVEFPDGENRMTWIRFGTDTLYHYYNDYKTDTWPVTFEVDMNEEITTGRFNPETDFLDIAGNWNEWGTIHPNTLFDRTWTPEGIYTCNALIDINNPVLEFQFRINGDWANSEFPGNIIFRDWIVEDTIGGNINLYDCQYSLLETPLPPYVYDAWISGSEIIGGEVTGNYLYYDPNWDPEGNSLYQWYYSPDPDSTLILIENASDQQYLIEDIILGNYMVFEVIPVSGSGTPNSGDAFYAWSSGPIGTIQPCLPEGITFTTQEQIDNFHTDYPSCNVIEGNVKIMGDDITNLNGLLGLKRVEGYLKLDEPEALGGLSGFPCQPSAPVCGSRMDHAALQPVCAA